MYLQSSSMSLTNWRCRFFSLTLRLVRCHRSLFHCHCRLAHRHCSLFHCYCSPAHCHSSLVNWPCCQLHCHCSLLWDFHFKGHFLYLIVRLHFNMTLQTIVAHSTDSKPSLNFVNFFSILFWLCARLPKMLLNEFLMNFLTTFWRGDTNCLGDRKEVACPHQRGAGQVLRAGRSPLAVATCLWVKYSSR